MTDDHGLQSRHCEMGETRRVPGVGAAIQRLSDTLRIAETRGSEIPRRAPTKLISTMNEFVMPATSNCMSPEVHSTEQRQRQRVV
jgi:hypothetical protein